MDKLNDMANNLFLEYKTKMAEDVEYSAGECARFMRLNNKVLDMTLDEQAENADYVTKQMVKRLKPTEFAEWVKSQEANYKTAIGSKQINATSIANTAAMIKKLQSSNLPADSFLSYHKTFTSLFKPPNFATV